MSGPSGRHKSPRPKFAASAEELARWKAVADDEGLSLADWVREACRAYELGRKRPGGNLTDADWRKVVAG